jgi:hypothetical protein
MAVPGSSGPWIANEMTMVIATRSLLPFGEIRAGQLKSAGTCDQAARKSSVPPRLTSS